MIAAISWVPKGVAKMVPEVADPPSKEELEEMLQTGALAAAGEDGDDDNEEGEMDVEDTKEIDEVALASVAAGAVGKDSGDLADALKELDMDRYDDEDDDGVDVFTKGLGDAYYASNEMDPYLKDKDNDDSEEEEDMAIRGEDSVIVCACNEDDISQLEVYVLEETEDGPNLYVHHDIIISAFPLCTAWLDLALKGGEKGNFIAVGSMEPSIEIWNLDVIDEVEPTLVLGGVVEKKKKKKGKKKSIKYKEDSHTDSVLGLAWNSYYRNVLASASADKTVKIWDMSTGKCTLTMDHHTDKVQAVAFNHYDHEVLLSGSFDRTIFMTKASDPSQSGYKWSVAADVESLAWDPHTEYNFAVSLENGMIQGFDIRTASSSSDAELRPSFTLHAHDKAASSISYSVTAPNLLASGSTDKTVKLWDLSNNQPSCVASKNPKAGAVFSVSFPDENSFMLAIGGSKGRLELWDTLSETAVAQKFSTNKVKKS